MDESGNYTRRGIGSVFYPYGDRIIEGNSLMKTPIVNFPEKPSPKARELHLARRDRDQFDERKRVSDSIKSEAEFELSEMKKTVKDLTSKIEGSNSRAKAQMHKLRRSRRDDQSRKFVTRKTENYEYAEVLKELEHVRKELSKLKLDMASVLDQKKIANREIEESLSKMQSHSSSADTLKKDIVEINEEQVLVELARIEAVKEHAAIEDQRTEEAKQYSFAMEETRKKVNDLIQEVDHAKELEVELAITSFDVDMLQSELKQIKNMEKMVERNEILKHAEDRLQKEETFESTVLFESVMKELEEAKKELASVREESFQFMASMDVIRDELKHVSEEKNRLKKVEDKADLTVQNLNSKLLRAKSKLEAASAAEENAKSIVSNILFSLEQLKKEAEEERKERQEVSRETAKLKGDLQKTETEIYFAEERMEAAMQELEAIKSSEAVALENLKNLIENTVRHRASAARHTSKITISNFEYEYLTGRAHGAEELADKKVAAAQAWIEALKASEKEILLKTDIAQREMEDLRAEKGKEAYRTKRSLSSKRVVGGDSKNMRQKREKDTETENLQPEIALPKRSLNISGKGTPARRAKARMSASPAAPDTPSSTSFTIRRRRKVMPNLAKFFSAKANYRKT